MLHEGGSANFFTDETVKNSLRQEGYANIPIAIDSIDTQRHFEAFKAVAEEANADDNSGEHIIHALAYSVEGRPEDADYYLNRSRVGKVNPYSRGGKGKPGTDDKDTAHFGPRSVERAESFYRNLGGLPKVVAEYLKSSTEIYRHTVMAVRPVFRELGIESIMLGEDPSENIIMLRSLIYTATEASHKADLHLDRSLATVAVAETMPGLVGAPGENLYSNPDMTLDEFIALQAKVNNSPVSHREGVAKFFLAAGSRDGHLPDDIKTTIGELPMFAHGVINTSPELERGAIVAFFNPHNGIKGYKVPQAIETGYDHLEDELKNRSDGIESSLDLATDFTAQQRLELLGFDTPPVG